MSEIDNPAARLEYWLRRASGSGDQNRLAVTVWCEVWGLDQNNIAERGECLRRGAALIDLCREVRLAASQLPDNFRADSLMEPFVEIERALDLFNQSATASMHGMLSGISGTAWHMLKVLGGILSANLPEETIADDQVVDYLNAVHDLIQDISGDTELDADLRSHLVGLLGDVHKALVDVRIMGTADLTRATEAVYGAMALHPDLWERIAKSKWGPRVAAIWLALASALGVVDDVHNLVSPPPPLQLVITQNGAAPHSHVKSSEDEIVDAEIVEDAAPQLDQ